MPDKFAPVHPGEILLEEFLQPMGISQHRLAQDISVHPRRINEIVHGKRSISADTALSLSRYFGLSERYCAFASASRLGRLTFAMRISEGPAMPMIQGQSLEMSLV